MASGKPDLWFLVVVQSADWALDMTQNMARGFEAAGYSVLLLLFDGRPERLQEIGQEISQKVNSREPFIIVDLNMVLNFEGFPANLVPWRYTWVGDNPIHHFRRLPNVQTNTLIGVPDRRYFEVYHALGLHENLLFMPHAGPDPIDDPLPMADRDIDFMFAGNFKLLPGSEEWKARTENLDPLVVAAIDETVGNILDNDAGSFQALTAALAQRGINWREMGAPAVWEAHRVAESYAEGLRRWDVLSRFENLSLHIVGEVSDDVARSMPNAMFHKFPGFPRMLEMIERTKMLINVTPKLADGSHDRICNGIARGSVMATTYSRYVAEQFDVKDDLVFFPRDMDGFDRELADLIADNSRLDRMAASSRAVYADHHTWHRRAGQLGQEMAAAVSAPR
jgi:hypothetical protein